MKGPHLMCGWGFTSRADVAAFASCWAQAQLAWPALARSAVACAALQAKRDQASAQRLLRWVPEQQPVAQWLWLDEAELQTVRTATQSARIAARFGTGSVSEALALRAVRQLGVNAGRLVLRRVVSADRQASLALAEFFPSPLQTGEVL